MMFPHRPVLMAYGDMSLTTRKYQIVKVCLHTVCTCEGCIVYTCHLHLNININTFCLILILIFKHVLCVHV